jgi:hypothetical protein
MLDYILTEHSIASLIAAIILTTAIAVAVVAIPTRWAAEHQCSKRAALLQTEYQYDFWTGCWVRQADNTWVEYSTVRTVGDK